MVPNPVIYKGVNNEQGVLVTDIIINQNDTVICHASIYKAQNNKKGYFFSKDNNLLMGSYGDFYEINYAKLISLSTNKKFPINKEKEIWSKVSAFIQNTSNMKIQISNDYTIDTYNPNPDPKDYTIRYGFRVNKIIEGDVFTLDVKCLTSGYADKKTALDKEKELFYFLEYGEYYISYSSMPN